MTRKKILTLALFVGALLLLTATRVLAASPAVSNPHLTLQGPTPTLTVTNPVAAMIAEFSGLDYTQVQAWHDEGISYGEIAMALFLAQSSNTSAEEIIADHQEGLGWGEIAKELDLTPGNRGRNLGAIMSRRTVTDTGTLQLQIKRGRDRPGVPRGWEQGKGHGLGRGHNK